MSFFWQFWEGGISWYSKGTVKGMGFGILEGYLLLRGSGVRVCFSRFGALGGLWGKPCNGRYEGAIILRE